MGITPACAGKSFIRNYFQCWNEDHPRMCGEKQTLPSIAACSLGSPPHVRGKVLWILTLFRRIRITPACAGKSVQCRNTHTVSRDHPRMCGEKFACFVFDACEVGSPPHVRGKGCRICAICSGGRITPACAGKSRKQYELSPRPQDHPRMCGEKPRPYPDRGRALGSPPHVRGKGINPAPAISPARITPACAGKSFSIA